MPASYDYRIDWNDDGSFTGTGDDVSKRIRAGITTRSGRDQSRALSPIALGTATYDLNNLDRALSPENTGSPIYPNVLPARQVRFQATLSNITYTLFRGFGDDFKVRPEKDIQRVEATANDALAKLKDDKATTTLFPSIRTGDAIHAVLDAVGWPAAARDIDAGATTIRWWCLNREEAWGAIENIVAAEGSPAIVMVDDAGRIVFRDRHHRLFYTLNANTSFEQGVGGWSGNGGALTQSSTFAHSGTFSGKIVPTGVAVNTYIESDQCPVVVGQTLATSAWLLCTVARTVNLNVNFYSAAHAYLSTVSTPVVVAANTWTFVRGFHTVPGGAGYASIIPTLAGTPPASNVLHADEVTLRAPSAAVATFRDTGTEPLYSAPMVYDQGWRDVVNNVTFDVDERGPDPDESVIWSTDQTYNVPAGGSIDVTFTTDEPFYEADIDVGDWTVLSGSAGIVIDTTQGRTATLTITSGSGGVVTDIQVRGHKVTTLRSLQVTASDPTSIATYGSKSGPTDAGLACVEDAQAIANYAVASRKARLPIVSIDVVGTSDVRLAQCLARKVSDRVRIIDVEGTGLNRDFFIEQIQHLLPQAQIGHRTTFGCEAVPTGAGLDDPSNVFLFDHAVNGQFGTGRFAS